MNHEKKYILYAVGFAVIWFFILLPQLAKVVDGDTSPYLQFAVFNIGLVIFFQIFLKSLALSRPVALRTSIGFVLVVLAIDTYMPDYHVTWAGEILKGAWLGQSASDYIWAISWQSLGVSGAALFIFTFVVTPILLLMIAAHLLPDMTRII
jgi:hypothetical protein